MDVKSKNSTIVEAAKAIEDGEFSSENLINESDRAFDS